MASTLRFPQEVSPDRPEGYRKVWEWAAIVQALYERRMLQPGKKALGFAVGQEPLISIFAHHGVEILATDLMADKVDKGWIDTGQHTDSVDALFKPEIVRREDFNRLVTFAPADMNDIGGMQGEYDFLWSSCAFEHLGTLEHGMAFVENAMRLLKPGGVAIHTTEYNVASNDDTVTEGCNVVYRKRDIEELDRRLRKIDCALEAIDFDAGHHPYDLLYDRQPYYQAGRVHIKLEIEGHISTSILLIAHKA